MFDLQPLFIFRSLNMFFFRYGCDIGYNDVSNRNSHEKKKHGGLFNGAERGPNIKQIMSCDTVEEPPL